MYQTQLSKDAFPEDLSMDFFTAEWCKLETWGFYVCNKRWKQEHILETDASHQGLAGVGREK